MLIRNERPDAPLPPELMVLLAEMRARRAFDAAGWIAAKATLLNDYMRRFGLKSCVLGVSGGIDSAVVLGLLNVARDQEGSPIRRIVPLLLPAYGTDGVTNQDKATSRGAELCRALGHEPVEIAVDAVHAACLKTVDGALGIDGKAWAVGQAVPYLRTSMMYYVTSLLSQESLAPILIGTTNRSEGGYLGYFGKASDGLVDVQVVSDLHKSEVYAVADALGIPDSIRHAVPTGDMFDAKTDEEVFGAPYDFVELYQNWLCMSEDERALKRASWSDDTGRIFDAYAANLEAMHRYNGHKYLGRSPAVHLDIIEAAVTGGWDNRPTPKRPSPAGTFVGAFAPRRDPTAVLTDRKAHALPFPAGGGAGRRFSGLLTPREVAHLLDETDGRDWVPVGQDGYRAGFDPSAAPVGSWRLSLFSETIADALWKRIAPALPGVRLFGPADETDWDGHPVWRPVGVNPLLRFIRYEEGNVLVPHYDAPYAWNELRRTLMSVVVGIEEAEEGGATRFVVDPQKAVPVTERTLADWTRFPNEDEILSEIRVGPGEAIVFDHRVLHDGARVATGRKTILRTDIIFERCDWYR